MIRALSVTGFHKAGKTKVVVAILRELVRRGYLVGTVKHIPEKDFTIDQSGKDTWTHARAGARIVVALAPREVAKIERRSARLEEILEGLSGLDFVIVEGFKKFKGLAKIVVAKNEVEAKRLVDEFTIACVGSRCIRIPTFGFGQVKKIVDIVEQKAYPPLPGLNCKHCGFESCENFAAAVVSGKTRWDACQTLQSQVKVTIDGRQIPLNLFAQKILVGAVRGMTSSLKGAKGEQIEVKVVKHA
ncbi:MAG: molybdopterin-guanine dinucleotide biosynthesis protein B [Methanobacteriota archaeon]